MDCQSPAVQQRVQDIFANYIRFYESALLDSTFGAGTAPRERKKLIKEKSASLFAYMQGVLSQARLRDDPHLLRDLERNAFAFLAIDTVRA